MTIDQISWQRAGSSGSQTGYYNSFSMYMGLCDSDELTDRFSDNYLPGTMKLVYSTGTQVMTADPDQWMTITLDTPFYYDGSANLIVEIQWMGGSNMFFTYMWDTGTNRALMNKSDVGSPSGTLYTNMSRLMLDSPSALQSATFGEIKSLWGI